MERGGFPVPIYEFRCRECGHRFEKLCPMGEDGKNLQCPKCGAGTPKRIMSAFSAQGTEGAAGSGCGTCSSSNCSSCGH